jgi:hypothetical protein
MTDGAMLALEDDRRRRSSAGDDSQRYADRNDDRRTDRRPTPSGNAGCVGDCNDGGSVGVDELVRGVNISLGNGELSSCGAFDVDGSDTVTVDELVKAVNAALNGCG